MYDRYEMPLDIRGWLGHGFTRDISAEERGVYSDLLAIAWQDDGIADSRISEPSALCRVIGISRRKFEKIWAKLCSRFALDLGGVWRNSRQESVRDRAKLHPINDRSSGKDRGKLHPINRRSSAQTSSELLQNSTRKSAESATADAPTHARARSLSLTYSGSETEKEERPDQQLAGFFQRRWVEVLKPDDGMPPRISKPDFFQLKKLLDDFGMERARQLVERFLADRDPFVVRNGHDARFIGSRVNSYRSSAQAEGPYQQNLHEPRRSPTLEEIRAKREADRLAAENDR